MLLLVTFLAYLPALRGGFLWDDNANVTKPELRPWSGLARIWFEPGVTEQYYPVLHSAFWAEHRMWGDQPLGYHLVNILFHALSAGLFYLILRRLTVPGAGLAAGIFALHPVCVESVAWIAEQKNTLSLLFYLAAALAWLRFLERRTPRAYVLASVLFGLALLSKSVTASLPAALLVLQWWRHGRLSWRDDVRPLVPWFIAGAAAGLFTAWVERTYIGAEGEAFALTPVERGLVAGRAIWFYLGKLCWPADLIFIYPRWRVNGASAAQYLYPLAAVLLVAGCWWFRRRSRAPLATALFFIGSLFPVLGFLNVYAFVFSFVTDHWQYLPSLGVITLAAAAAARMLDRLPRGGRAFGLVLPATLLLVLGTATWRQCGQYRDPRTFYQAILDKNPDCAMAHNNLGLLLATAGDAGNAEAHYVAALRLKPDYARAHFNLANVQAGAGRLAEAIEHYESALRGEPANVEARNNLGNVLAQSGRLPEAIALFWSVLQAGTDSAETRHNLGTALALVGRADEAIRQFAAAVRLTPDDPEAQRCLADALLQAGRVAEALPRYEAWLRLQPSSPAAHNLTGVALAQLGRLDEARGQFEAALHLSPGYPAAQDNLARVQALGAAPAH
jgi:tetratricopeptide (TPR) repeat protein